MTPQNKREVIGGRYAANGADGDAEDFALTCNGVVQGTQFWRVLRGQANEVASLESMDATKAIHTYQHDDYDSVSSTSHIYKYLYLTIIGVNICEPRLLVINCRLLEKCWHLIILKIILLTALHYPNCPRRDACSRQHARCVTKWLFLFLQCFIPSKLWGL